MNSQSARFFARETAIATVAANLRKSNPDLDPATAKRYATEAVDASTRERSAVRVDIIAKSRAGLQAAARQLIARVAGDFQETEDDTGSASSFLTQAHANGTPPKIGLQPSGYSRPVHKLARRPQTGRNANCPCGSGLKYKRCCGSVQTKA